MEFVIEIAVKTAGAVSGLGKIENSADKAKASLNAAGAEADSLNRAIARSGVTMVRQGRFIDAIGQKTVALGDKMTNLGGRMSAFATLPIVGAFVKAHQEASEAKDAISSVDGTIKSMGRTAEFSAAKLATLATKQTSNTLYDNDAVLRDVTQNLLTFGNVHKDIFDRAQSSIIDYAAASKQDLRAASTQVAKALQTPEGALALSKTGAITKDDAMRLKTIAATNGMQAYQLELLKALDKQYKGQAGIAAAADDAARNAKKINDAWENIGTAVDRLIVKLEPAITRFTLWIKNVSPGTLDWAIAIAAVIAVAGPLSTVFGFLVQGIGGVVRAAGFFYRVWGGVLIGLGRAKAPIEGVLSLTQWFGSVIGRLLGWVWKMARLVPMAFRIVGQVLLWVGRLFLANPIIAVIAAIAAAAYWLWSNWSWVGPKFWAMWAMIKNGASQAWAWIQATFNAGIAWLTALPGRMLAIGQGIMQGLVNGISSGAAWVRDKIMGLASQVSDWFKSALGINSPSLVFAGFGGNITDGLAQGLDRTARNAVRVSQRVADAVADPHTRALSARLVTNVGRLNAPSAVRNRVVPSTAPSISRTSNLTSFSHAGVSVTNNFGHARDPKSVARVVARELDRHDYRSAIKSNK
jgi:hypothetical protein